MEILGIIKAINSTEAISDRFKKRDFVCTIEHTTQYPQHILLQFTQDKCNVLDQYQVGQEVKIQFNLRGREWNGANGIQYFNTLEAWRIESLTTKSE